MNSSNDISELAKNLLAKVEENPADWPARKSAALKLYEDGNFLEAADTVWNAPEMPATDLDVAFAVKIVSRARPNRSIRLVYEVLRRNTGKAEQNMAMARAFNLIGLPMMASRFYGAALAISSKYFDIGFEQQSLWFDDSGSLIETWENSSQDIKPPFSKPMTAFLGDAINLADLNEDVLVASPATAPITASVSKPAALSGKPVLRAAKPTSPTPVRPAVPAAKKMPKAAPMSSGSARPTASLSRPQVPAPPVPAKGAPKPMLPPVRESNQGEG